MKITQIRNATILIEFGGSRFLVDPVLAEKDSYPGFPGMYKEDVYKVFKAAPRAMLIASHMDAVNHAALTRAELRDYSAETGMIDRLLVPEDGETLIF